jgi:16S rRNA (adenine1518-N6/adenine1519-N6)-dimethyltransferase
MPQKLLTTSELVKKYQLNTLKSLGQNFILDKNFTDKIARGGLGENQQNFNGDYILEIGPGPGGLTRSILDLSPKKLVVIEKDLRCQEILQEYKKFYGETLEIFSDDALTIDETKIFGENKFKIIANLPYNIGTTLIFKWLKILPKIQSITVMLQKEVAERIVANLHHNHYGRLAVMINLLCDTKINFLVSKSVFVPPPKVDSAVISIVPSPEKMQKYFFPELLKELEFVVFTAFNQRRKMLKSSLQNCFKKYKLSSENFFIEKFFSDLNIDYKKRAENLSIEEYFLITKKFIQITNERR